VQPHFDVSDYMNRAYIMMINKRYHEAIEVYDHILERDPNNVEALIRKGIALHSLGRFDEAISAYDKVLKINRDDVRGCIGKVVLCGFWENKKKQTLIMTRY
jgi:tetratricopeptide (TPR) repeat protein